MDMLGEWPLGGHGNSVPFHVPSPVHLFHLPVAELYSLNWESGKSNISLSSMSHSSKLIEPEEEVPGTSNV